LTLLGLVWTISAALSNFRIQLAKNLPILDLAVKIRKFTLSDDDLSEKAESFRKGYGTTYEKVTFKLENLGESACRLRRMRLIRKDSIIQQQKSLFKNWMLTSCVVKTEQPSIDISNQDIYSAFLTIHPEHADVYDRTCKHSIPALRKEGSETILEVILASEKSKADFEKFRDEYVLVVEIAISAIRSGGIVIIWDNQILPLNGEIWMNTNVQGLADTKDEDIQFVELTLE
jgi:hypothetical protein